MTQETQNDLLSNGAAATNNDGNQEEIVLTKAVLRAAGILDLNRRELANILHVSKAQMSRLGTGKSYLQKGKSEFQLAAYLVRCFRSLGVLYGKHETDMQKWLRSRHLVLGPTPLDRMVSIEGLVETMSYLDNRRARI